MTLTMRVKRVKIRNINEGNLCDKKEGPKLVKDNFFFKGVYVPGQIQTVSAHPEENVVLRCPIK